ncbi:MAG: enoyl-CoA hydratase-related protein, partial [Chloroflexota bacterium]|nr:enoyl-CoA hydratase-related protein [Chloroflexota bacterium]
EMLLTGDPISAEEAQLCGLVNRVVPSEEIEIETRSLAERICNHSVFTVGIGKQAFYRQLDMAQKQAYVYAGEVMVTNAIHADAQEGICAFLEKRQPEWQE